MHWTIKTGWLSLCLALASCSYNPFVSDNQTTGSPVGAAVGAGAGAGFVAAWNGPKPLMGLAGLTGGAIGYYVTTLRYASGGVIKSGGEVYKVGQNVGIMIPTDQLFFANSSDLLPTATPILNSAVAVLKRYPNNNILISGNSSGFDRPKREQKLTLLRAKEVAAYLWKSGVNNFIEPTIDTRKLRYVGFANKFPISTNLNNRGIRENSRIQITAYPTPKDLKIDQRALAIHNVGSLKNDVGKAEPTDACGNVNDKDMTGCFKETD